ncbi:MAG: lysophospholipase [Candidatus Thiodiazotropha lotti]|nr:lysophospholipase [Candidatus Thiodiazotropha lotti]MCW4188227.1 lysophospholipase [Candidatus Thiodiazotropha lotti]
MLFSLLKKSYFTILSIFLGYAILCLYYYLNQVNIIFPASRIDTDTEFTFTIDHQELFIDTPDGARLHGVLFRAIKPKGVILHFHGNAENMLSMQYAAEPFVDRNYSFLAMDYRSYGKSSGELSEENLFADAALFLEYLKKAGWESSKIILYGRSIGTGVAIQLASKADLGGMILYAPFYSLTDLADYHFPLLPSDLLLKFPMDSASYLNGVQAPVLILHGSDDRIIPLDQAERLARIKGKLVVLINGRHNDLYGHEKFWFEIDTFLASI